jgi:pyruvate dehydrogenase E2 component (dihydrolipoamide acetyltransferase)
MPTSEAVPTAAPIVVRMPSVLAGAEEAALANWLVAPGDTVTVGMPIAEIETEKALVEYVAEDAGVVGRLVVAVGDSAAIGDPIAVLVAPGTTDADIDAALGVAPPLVASPSPAPAPAVAASAPTVPASPPPPALHAIASGVPQGTPAPTSTRIFASPLVRKIAAEQGIDLSALSGTGPNGRIVRRDIERLGAQPKAAPAASPAPAPAQTFIPHTPMRRAIARRLTESKASTPHFYMATECVVDELLDLRKRVNETAPVKISVNDFVVLAVAAAFRDVPEANVTWREEGLVHPANVDISIAVATDGGLVTPVLRGVQSKKLSQIARETQDLAQRARDRRLRQEELEGGVFSVSNLGMYGTLEFSAIINPPQSGILAVGAAKPQPVAVDGAVAVATVLRCTLSVDHRAIDGALAARWLAAFTERIEHPLSAII